MTLDKYGILKIEDRICDPIVGAGLDDSSRFPLL